MSHIFIFNDNFDFSHFQRLLQFHPGIDLNAEASEKT